MNSSFIPLGIRNTAHGEMIFLPQDTYVGKSIACYGQYSEEEAEAFARLLKPGMTAVDVGANIGYFTVVMSKLLGPSGRTYAAEPQRLLFRILCANLAMNGCANASCFMVAAGRQAGAAWIPRLSYREERNYGGVAVGGAAGVETRMIAIDDLQLNACHFIKVDVEGMEKQVLEGALQTIGQFQPLLWVENDRAETARELVDFIYSIGYDAYWQINALFNPGNFDGNHENVFGRLSSFNLLCKPASHPLPFRAERCTPDNAVAPGMVV